MYQRKYCCMECLDFSCLFSFSTCMVSPLMFKSFIHFEFFLVYGISWWSRFIFLHVLAQISQSHLLKKLFLTPGYNRAVIGTPHKKSARSLILDFPASRSVRNKLFEPRSLWDFIAALKLTKSANFPNEQAYIKMLTWMFSILILLLYFCWLLILNLLHSPPWLALFSR